MTVPVYYDPRQSVADVNSYSPSASKPAKFMTSIAAKGIAINTMPVCPISKNDLLLAHAASYVDGIFDGTVNNGFENNDRRVPESCLWTIGSLTTAVLDAGKHGRIACSPTSGFHHAGHAWGGGFCTFNGLAVAAAKFIQANPGKKVAILDLDYHDGDGTRSVLKANPALSDAVLHLTSGKHFFDKFSDESHEFFAWLYGAIERIQRFKPDVVIYQAGADMSIHDPLGGLLTDTEMAHRDQLVFSRIKCPIVFNLAGGYRSMIGNTDPVIKLHLTTLGIANREA